mmetsp:Transcript_140560/g.244697  ORF Transcript_140560/g.244697 Transcript_140560/m.244697 type:complete len:93 (-) Transcript_140560:185-463(-)
MAHQESIAVGCRVMPFCPAFARSHRSKSHLAVVEQQCPSVLCCNGLWIAAPGRPGVLMDVLLQDSSQRCLVAAGRRMGNLFCPDSLNHCATR